MIRCQARLPLGQRPRVVIAESGWPEAVQDFCEQSVGIATWTDGTGTLRAACSIEGHMADVRSQSDCDEDRAVRVLDEMRERARREWEEDWFERSSYA